jgi:hypothetical protein
MKSYILPSFSSFFLFVVFISCSSPEKKAEKFDEETKAVYSEKAEALFHEMVGPAELPYALMSIGADFAENIPNDPNKAETYKKSRELAAVNLGIYVTDISYVVAYHQYELAKEYYLAGNELAEFLGEGRIFNQALLRDYGDRIEEDSAITQLKQAVIDARMSFKRNNRARIGTLILTGIFIERLYMATQILSNYPGDDLPAEVKQNVLAPLMTSIYNQKTALNNLIEYVNEIIKPEDRRMVYDELIDLQLKYEVLDSAWKAAEDDVSTEIRTEDFFAIASGVQAIRGMLVN